jgi:beta-glucosidase-like glycosyl hydrolase
VSGGNTKLIAALKHYTAYSVETGRGSTNFWISQHDMEKTYLPPYRMAIENANNLGIMCSYASVNGVPMCGSTKLMRDTARKQWGFDGYIVTDCHAVENMYENEHWVANATVAAAAALIAGVDINCGYVWNSTLASAVREGFAKEVS